MSLIQNCYQPQTWVKNKQNLLTMSLLSYVIFFASFYLIAHTEKRFILNNIKSTEERLKTLETSVGNLFMESDKFRKLLNTFSLQLNGTAKFSSGVSGALFTAWGSLTCPNNNTASLVYSGFAGGSYFNHPGTAPKTLCFPRDPILGVNTKAPSTYGYVYGSEYETTFFGSGSTNEDVPCSVCTSLREYHVLMIPGRNKCYSGWTEQYHGYLAGNYYAYKGATDFVCLVENIDKLRGGQSNQDGRRFYGVVSTCGSLPCPPYNESLPLTCVVCTQ